MKKSQLPTKRDIFNALRNQDNAGASETLHMITGDPKWGDYGNHRCPLCGYENVTTNIHRHCPKAPIDASVPKNLPDWMRRMSVPMYFVEE